mgnify:CR=1 FL=1
MSSDERVTECIGLIVAWREAKAAAREALDVRVNSHADWVTADTHERKTKHTAMAAERNLTASEALELRRQLREMGVEHG